MKFDKTISLLIIAAQTILVHADKVTFKVLAVNGTPYVNVNNQQVQMTVDEYPLYKAEVDINAFPVQYNYGVVYNDSSNEVEPFERTRGKDEKALNEFFGRSVTVLEHPKLPKAYNSFSNYVPSRLFDDTHVATIIINCDQNALNQMYSNLDDLDLSVPAEVIYASPDTVKTFKNAELGISGQSTRGVAKLSYKIKNLENETKELYNRTAIKLRAEHMDPSFLRDKLYGDILNFLGAPAAQNKFARVFINGEAVGLFNLSDDISNNRYLRETYNKGEKFTQDNPIFKADFCPDCNPGGYGDLGYYGDDVSNPMYQIYSYKGKDKTKDESVHISEELLPLLRDIDNYAKGVSNQFPMEQDSFIKYLAAEFINGGVDNFWNKPGNFFIFKDVAKNQWYFHDADFHYSFGVGGDFEAMLYTPLANYPPDLGEGISMARPPVDALLSHPENKAKLNEIVDRLLKTSFHTGALYPRIESLANLIKEDVEWDFSLPRVSLNNNIEDADLVYTLDDFENNVYQIEESGKFGINTLRYYIENKINTVAQELGTQVPANPLNDLGYVEVPQKDNDDKNGKSGKSGNSSSGSIKTVSWSVLSSMMILFISYILY